MKLRILAFVTILAGCSINSLPPLAGKPKIATSSATEQALLTQFPNLVQREGNVLKVASRGGWLSYENKDCEVSDDCASYLLDRTFLNGRLFGIEVGYYEGGDYILADTESVHECTGGAPVFSPNNQMFVVAEFNEAYETCGEGLALWRLDFPLRKVRTISPHVLTYPEKPRWRGDDCVEFTAIAGQDAGDPRRSFYLVRDEPEWRLEREPDPVCLAKGSEDGA